jgi:ligand-binding sensor domain-containing protein
MNRIIKMSFVSLIFVISFSDIVFSQQVWTNYTAGSGLPASKVRRLCMAPDGTGWCISDPDFYYFDGQKWILKDVLASENLGHVQSNFSLMAVDNRGRLIIGLQYCLWRIKDDKAEALAPPDGYMERVNSLTTAPNGDIWAGTDFGYLEGKFISKISDSTWTKYSVDDKNITIDSISAGSDGTVFAASLAGGYRFDGTSWSKIYTGSDNNRLLGIYRMIEAGPNDSAWITDVSSNVLRFNGETQTWTRYTKTDGLVDDFNLRDIAVAPNGQVWFATPSGVSRYDGVSWRTFTVLDGLLSNDVYSISFGGDGSVWFGTSIGVSRFDPSAPGSGDVTNPAELTGYTIKNFQNSFLQKHIVSQGDYIWYGTADGLVQRNVITGTEQQFFSGDGLSLNGVSHLISAPNGDIWVTSGNGAACYNGSVWKKFTSVNGLTGSSITDIAAAPNGNIWIGFPGGMSVFNGSTWRTFYGGDGLIPAEGTYYSSGSLCNALAVGPDGTVWSTSSAESGSIKYGLYTNSVVSSFNGTLWTKQGDFPTRYINVLTVGGDGKVWAGSGQWMGSGGYVTVFDGISWNRPEITSFGETVSSIRISPEGIPWVCIPSSGLFRNTGAVWEKFTTADGLPGAVYDIAFQPDGTPWAVSPNGLSRLEGNRWETVVGVDSPQTNTFKCAAVDSRGVLWAGSGEGILSFDGSRWAEASIENGGYLVSLIADKTGTVWAGFQNGIGLWRYNGIAWKKMGIDDGLNVADRYSVMTTAILPDNGMMATIYEDNGYILKLITFHNGVWETSSLGSSVVANVVTPDGGNWFATEWTVSWYANGQSGLFTVDRDFPGKKIISLAAGPEGKIWVGTDAGASLYDGAGWDSSIASKLLGRDVRTIMCGADGKTWFGTSSGISVLDGTEWSYLTEELPNKKINCITASSEGTVWIATDGGMTRLIPKPASIETGTAPSAFSIKGNYPNPFNPGTVIQYSLKNPERIELVIYSVTGQKIRTLVSERMDAGSHSAVWNGRDDSGKQVSSGAYIALLRAGKALSSHMMMLIK